MAAATVMTDEDIIQRLKEIIATVLMMSPDEISPDASLIDDLGVESIDFLDITFRLEETFGIPLPRRNPIQRIADRYGREELIQDGKLTLKGAQLLRFAFPEAPQSSIFEGMREEEVPSLITLKSYLSVVKRGLEISKWHPKKCDRCGGTSLGLEEKEKLEFPDEIVPLGPVYQCHECNNMMIAPSFDEQLYEKIHTTV